MNEKERFLEKINFKLGWVCKGYRDKAWMKTTLLQKNRGEEILEDNFTSVP